MKTYPSIPSYRKVPRGEYCYAFEKLDGSNIRVEWRGYKKGDYLNYQYVNPDSFKFGTRHRLFDAKDPEYGRAIQIFLETQSVGLLDILKSKEYRSNNRGATFFLEMFGPNSFGAYHNFDDKFELKLIDVDIIGRGFVMPGDLMSLWNKVPHAEIVYTGCLTDLFIDYVRNGKFPVKEGVVTKGGKDVHHIWRAKIKTNWWMSELKRRAEQDARLKQLLTENEQEQYETANSQP